MFKLPPGDTRGIFALVFTIAYWVAVMVLAISAGSAFFHLLGGIIFAFGTMLTPLVYVGLTQLVTED